MGQSLDAFCYPMTTIDTWIATDGPLSSIGGGSLANNLTLDRVSAITLRQLMRLA